MDNRQEPSWMKSVISARAGWPSSKCFGCLLLWMAIAMTMGFALQVWGLPSSIKGMVQDSTNQADADVTLREKEGPVTSPQVGGESVVPNQDQDFAQFRQEINQKKILVTGGAGFVGSHLVDRLIKDGHNVIVLDNLITGKRRNIEHWVGHPNFQFILHDAVQPIYLEVDEIYHLASPASPPQYMKDPIKTIMANTEGTRNMLDLARRNKARFLFTSTSEVYGDPQVHPQKEEYWGNVNPVGPRSCYDESKRLGETLCMAYRDRENVDVRIARIFNTFGPRMSVQDGRVVSNFIIQALSEEPITIYGKGKNTRSFQYVSDLVEGLIALMSSNYTMPVNLGNPDEYEVGEFATLIKKMTGSKSEIRQVKGVRDDPTRRKPDISLAWKVLGWKPKVQVADGLKRTIQYFKNEMNQHDFKTRNLYLPWEDRR